MTVKEKIRLLLNVEVETNNLALLKENPDVYTKNPEDLSRIKLLFDLLEEAEKLEDKNG